MMDHLQKIANQSALYLADGRMFFIGSFLSVVAAGLCRHFTGWISSKLDLLAWIGAICVLISATPLPWWLYALWFSLFLSAMLFSGKKGNKAASEDSGISDAETRRSRSEIVRITAFSLYAVVTIGLCILEWSYQRKPVIVVPQNQIIYVMGDSISAGIGTSEHNWPEVWGKLSGRQIINLAKPGATVADVLRDHCAGITSPDAVVMVEIGGNDLLGSTKAGDFHVQLDHLLSRLHGGRHRVILFELPLLPFCNRYGSAQRTLAGKYGVTLIPKRVMVRVFGMNGATLDGLHLSQPGHDEMARLVHEMVTTGP